MKSGTKGVDCVLKEIQSIKYNLPREIIEIIEASKIVPKTVLDAAAMYAVYSISSEQLDEIVKENNCEHLSQLINEYCDAVSAECDRWESMNQY